MNNHDIPSPLALYLQKHHKITASDIGRKMSKRLGREVSTASMSQWWSGAREPGPLEQEAMMVATSGGVRPGQWHRWKVRIARAAMKAEQ